MRELWSDFWRRTGEFRSGGGNPAETERRVSAGQDAEREESVFRTLAGCYGQAHRSYHTFDHIAFCLRRLSLCAPQPERPETVEAAVWFHDAVYDPRSETNEEASAALAERLLGEAGFEAGFIERVCSLVRSTAYAESSGSPPAPGSDEACLRDLDLSILGSSRPEYDRYRQAIRREYGHLSADEFRSGRAAFLRALLEQPAIYATVPFRERCERRARLNMLRELRELLPERPSRRPEA